MEPSPFDLIADDGAILYVHRWLPAGPARGIVQIVHGMAEHAARYARLADALCARGYAVYAPDHRGHGRTAKSDADLGFFAERDGWDRVVADLRSVETRARGEHPGKPLCLFGHSMGSFLAHEALLRRGGDFAAVVLSGSNGSVGALGAAGRVVARIERLRVGPRGASAVLGALSFGAYNKRFAPARTEFDWLSRDPAEVDQYIADPRCGFACGTQLWIDLLDGLSALERPERTARVPPTLPVYVFGGELDPVGGAVGTGKLVAALRAAGLSRVTHKLYPAGRHEMLNETNRDEVTGDLVTWLDGVMPGA